MSPWLSVGSEADAYDYLALLLFLGLGLFISLLFLVLSYVRGSFNPSKEKSSAYECGFSPLSSESLPFALPFYRVAILFIIFDIEVALLFPWGLNVLSLGWVGFWHAMMFLGILGVGFMYELFSGALEWQ